MDIDDFFIEFSTGTCAFLGGVAAILTGTFLIYNVLPLVGTEHTDIFFYSMGALVLGIFSPLLFYLSDLADIPDAIGKISSGSALTVLIVIVYHVGRTQDLGKWGFPLPEIILSGLLGLMTSLLFTRGVIVPTLTEEPLGESGWELEEGEEFEEDDFEEEEFEDESIEDEEFEEDSEKFPEEENEPW